MSRTAGKIRRAGRILLFGVFVACFLFASGRAEAQGMPPGGPSGGFGSGITPVSWSGYPGPQAMPGPAYPFAGGVTPGVGYHGSDGLVTTQVPEYHEEFDPHPIENFLGDALGNVWFRAEYMNWSIERPGNALLGTPTLNTQNPRERFPVVGGTARVMDLDKIDLNDNNGIRMVLGVPLKHGTWENEFFIIEQASDNVVPPEGLGGVAGTFIGTTVFIDGQPTNFLRVYDESFRASFSSDVWSGEMNVVMDPLNAPATGEGLKLRPIVGIRYMGVHERLQQKGVFNSQVTIIDSDTMNNLYGINFGLRTELVHRWFTLGVTPKVALGMNTYRAQVISQNFVSTTDPRLTTRTDESDFAAIMDLTLYGKVNVTENISLFASYGVMWLSRVARPHETIEYNVNGILGNPVSTAIRAQEKETNIWLQGFTVGGEIRFK